MKKKSLGFKTIENLKKLKCCEPTDYSAFYGFLWFGFVKKKQYDKNLVIKFFVT